MTPTAEKTEDTTQAGGFDLAREGGDGWRPEQGDKLVGQITSIAARWSDWGNERKGGFYPVLTIAAEDGSTQAGKAIAAGSPIAFHAFHTIPFKRLMQLKPLEGERIGIMYHGPVENSDGKTKSEVYTVKVQREVGAGPDPYAGLRAPGGKDVKEEVKTANGADVSDAELNEMLS